jgi:hypothetical protein
MARFFPEKNNQDESQEFFCEYQFRLKKMFNGKKTRANIREKLWGYASTARYGKNNF